MARSNPGAFRYRILIYEIDHLLTAVEDHEPVFYPNSTYCLPLSSSIPPLKSYWRLAVVLYFDCNCWASGHSYGLNATNTFL